MAARVLLAGGGTGGHLYPALNLAESMRLIDPDLECFFLGSQRGIEARVLPGTGHAFRLLPLQPIYRQRPWRNWRLLAATPAVVRGVRQTFRELDPQLVVGTGGYVSGPALAWGVLTGRPTAIQEQNAHPGLVTRMLAPRVRQIHLGYPEAERHLRVGAKSEVFALGNPVAPGLSGAGLASPGPTFDWPAGKTLLVTGGSQGARGLNLRLIEDLERAAGGLPAETSSVPRARRGAGEGSTPVSALAPAEAGRWPPGVSVVWIAGRDHAAGIAARVAVLPWADRIRVVPFIEDLGGQLGHVTLALSRSGAMSVAELCAAGCPAVLVPLPTAAADHQTSNARALEASGAAEVHEERALVPGELWTACRTLLEDDPRLARMSAAARGRGRPHAAMEIARALLGLLGGAA